MGNAIYGVCDYITDVLAKRFIGLRLDTDGNTSSGASREQNEICIPWLATDLVESDLIFGRSRVYLGTTGNAVRL
jgi:hypothetical protein